MAIHRPPLIAPSLPYEPLSPPVARVGWRIRLARARLRCWGVWVCATDPGQHPIARMVARGEWAKLDRICDELEAER